MGLGAFRHFSSMKGKTRRNLPDVRLFPKEESAGAKASGLSALPNPISEERTSRAWVPCVLSPALF